MIAPTDRGMLGEFRASGYVTFLARPVRGETLLRVLLAGPQPARPPVAGAVEGRQPPAAREAPPARPFVLVAEDNDINAMLARATLRQGRAPGRRRRQRQGGGGSRRPATATNGATTWC